MTPGSQASSELTRVLEHLQLSPTLSPVSYLQRDYVLLVKILTQNSHTALLRNVWWQAKCEMAIFACPCTLISLWCEISGSFQENEHLSVRQYIFLVFKHSETAATLIRTSQTSLRMWTTCRRHGPFLQSSHKHSPGITSDCYRIQRIFASIAAAAMFWNLGWPISFEHQLTV